VISAHDYPNAVAVMARDLTRARSRIICTVHNTLSHEMAHATKRKIKAQAVVDRRFYPRADAVVTVSHGAEEDLVKTLGLPDKNFTTIYNPVVSEHLEKQAAEPLNHSWFRDGGPPVLLAVGGFKVAKDHETLLKAFALVRAERPVRLLLLGEGKLREELSRLAEDLGITEDLQMPGFVDNPYQYMARASLFVLSSVFEGLPTVIIEALACGCPVVSTDCPSGPKEILENDRYGTLVPMGDVPAMAGAILQSLDSAQEKSVLISRGKDFSVKSATKKYLALIDRLA